MSLKSQLQQIAGKFPARLMFYASSDGQHNAKSVLYDQADPVISDELFEFVTDNAMSCSLSTWVVMKPPTSELESHIPNFIRWA